jgi:hypothetical protein
VDVGRKVITRKEGIIKMNLKETEWGGMDWTDLAHNRDQCWALVSMVMNHEM